MMASIRLLITLGLAVVLPIDRASCNMSLQGTLRIGLSHGLAYRPESLRFMLYALEKMTETKCLTFVSDDYLEYMVGSLAECSVEYNFCTAYNYDIHYEGGNLSTEVRDTLKVGYDRRCAGYVILLYNTLHVIEFLQYGQLLRVVNTRAKFLIWYEGNDKIFEANELWDKIPNVIFFHSKPKKRKSGLLFTVRQLKWPIAINSTEPRLRVLEFWGDKSTDNDARQIWFYDKTLDLKNITLRIVVVEHPPGVIKYTDSFGNVEYAGTEIQIMRSLAKTMKFSYDLQDADPETKWGGQGSSNNSCQGGREFYGAVGRLIYGEVDIGIGSFFILKHYLEHIDMSIPIEVACTSLLAPNPLQRPRYLALILPFRGELWLLVLATSFFIGPLLMLFFASFGLHVGEYGIFRFKQAVLTSFRIMTQIAIHLWPKFWPMRLFIAWYWLFWFCMTSGYKAAMVSFLTIPLYNKAINNLHDLAESDFGLGGWGTELQRIFFQHLQMNTDIEMGKKLADRYEVLTNLDDGISRVANGHFALYENVRYLRFIRMTRNLSKGAPTMRVLKQCIVPVHIGFAYQKNSPLTLTINRYIRSFQESGLTKRWAQRLVALTREHNRNNPEAMNSDSSKSGGNTAEGDEVSESDTGQSDSKSQKVLRLQDLQGAVYLLFLGLGFSALVFSVEIFCSRRRRRRSSRKLEAKVIHEMINKSKKRMIIIRALEAKPLDIRVRPPPKLKPLKKQPPFPYLD